MADAHILVLLMRTPAVMTLVSIVVVSVCREAEEAMLRQAISMSLLENKGRENLASHAHTSVGPRPSGAPPEPLIPYQPSAEERAARAAASIRRSDAPFTSAAPHLDFNSQHWRGVEHGPGSPSSDSSARATPDSGMSPVSRRPSGLGGSSRLGSTDDVAAVNGGDSSEGLGWITGPGLQQAMSASPRWLMPGEALLGRGGSPGNAQNGRPQRTVRVLRTSRSWEYGETYRGSPLHTAPRSPAWSDSRAQHRESTTSCSDGVTRAPVGAADRGDTGVHDNVDWQARDPFPVADALDIQGLTSRHK